MDVHPFKRLFTLVLVLLLAIAAPACNNDGDGSSSESTESDSDTDTSEAAATINGECFSCYHSLADGDDCGSEMLTGTTSSYTFSESSSSVSLNINNQITFSGTISSGVITLNDSWSAYRGPGCDMEFTNAQITGEVIAGDEVQSSWTGTMSYTVELDTSEDDCDSYSFRSCDAVHVIHCSSSSCS